MKLPLIKHIHGFIQENDEDYVEEAIELLEHISESSSLKDEELDVLGELLSNLYGAKVVHQLVKTGMTEKEAANLFMKRVLGAIDK
ncbi:MAG: hypothetical protein CMC96_05485 [Flavobacteriales bacterium]|nr:hypothetical protein [Flavobacteriales bacterium]|tara:strand:- start:6765 stop:7022 length:258 start_codon:yes stop_codon:yes gene_type:complete